MLAADQDRLLISLFGKRCAAETTITLTGWLFDLGWGKKSTSLRTELCYITKAVFVGAMAVKTQSNVCC